MSVPGTGRRVSFHPEVEQVTFEENAPKIKRDSLKEESPIEENKSHWTFHARNDDCQVVVAKVLTCLSSCQVSHQEVHEIKQGVKVLGAERYMAEHAGDLADRIEQYVKPSSEAKQRYESLIKELRSFQQDLQAQEDLDSDLSMGTAARQQSFTGEEIAGIGVVSIMVVSLVAAGVFKKFFS